MSGARKWRDGEYDSEGVRAQLLAQKAIYESESQGWRHPLSRLAAIFVPVLLPIFLPIVGGWRKLWRH